MIREKLVICTLGSDGKASAVLVEGKPLEILDFTMTARRMGAAEITCDLHHIKCLDDLWTKDMFVEFRNERFLLLHTPSSSKDNTDQRYRHQLTFQRECDVLLANMYFYDGVYAGEDHSTAEKWHSNSPKFSFFGTLDEFVARFNAVLGYRGLSHISARMASGYAGTTEAKFIEFEGKKLFEALQEAYTVWEMPFRVVEGGTLGTYEVVFGENPADVLTEVFEYGPEDELISISKNNQNALLINCISGYGSADNVPYYYPNPSPRGDLRVLLDGKPTGKVAILDMALFGERFPADGKLIYRDNGGALEDGYFIVNSGYRKDVRVQPGGSFRVDGITSSTPQAVKLEFYVQLSNPGSIRIAFGYDVDKSGVHDQCQMKPVADMGISLEIEKIFLRGEEIAGGHDWESTALPQYSDGSGNINYHFYGDSVMRTTAFEFETDFDVPGMYHFVMLGNVKQNIPNVFGWGNGYLPGNLVEHPAASFSCNIGLEVSGSAVSSCWEWVEGKVGYVRDITKLGLYIPSPSEIGNRSYITQEVLSYVQPTGRLMPYSVRHGGMASMFLKALNDFYLKSDGTYRYFANPWDPRNPREYVIDFDDIKPSIKGAVGPDGPIDVIGDVYFEPGFNIPEVDGDKAAYDCFYVQLRPLGFNLFDNAIETGGMKLSMTSGNCGGCEFDIRVDEHGRNLVQVDANGNLVVENGRVKTGAPMDEQNDTTSDAVWLKVSLDTNTYGGGDQGTMPNWDERERRGQRPVAGDTFVILNMRMPEYLVIQAEKRLEEALLDYMEENNCEKYGFDIKFSRVYLAQNPDIRDSISENSAVIVRYDGKLLPTALYVSDYTYKANQNEALPDIYVSVSDSITDMRSPLEEKISQVFHGMVSDIIPAEGNKNDKPADGRYLRKDQDDTAVGKPSFVNGVDFGEYKSGATGKGGAVHLDTNGRSHAEFDFLSVRKLATFSEVEIDKTRAVGGKLILSLASMICSRVEPIFKNAGDDEPDVYRCYFTNVSDDGNRIYNEFAVDDLAFCQSFNDGVQQYYWRPVVEVGDDYIDLSNRKVLTDIGNNQFADMPEYDYGSKAPAAGDNIIQLGNRTDTSRQSAQVLSAYDGDDESEAPSLTMYAGIEGYTLEGKEMFYVRRDYKTYKDTQAVDDQGRPMVDEDGKPVMVDTIYDVPSVNCYGDMYFGQRDRSSYVWWDSVHHKLYIRGSIYQTAAGDVITMVNWCGLYDPSRLYKVNDVVIYNGQAYRCIKDTTGAVDEEGNPIEIPTNTEFWELWIMRGEKGASGITSQRVKLYKADVNGSVETAPGDTTFNFVTGEISGTLNGWSLTVPNTESVVYETSTYAIAEGTVAQIPGGWGQWSRPSRYTGAKGEQGKPGQASFTSFVFARGDDKDSIPYPTGGSFVHPVPDEPEWTDGVPEGPGTLWMSHRTFTTDGSAPQDASWSEPAVAADTADIDFEWSHMEEVNDPTTDAGKADASGNSWWHDTADENDIWMAIRKKNGDTWSDWQVMKIKGENGNNGVSGATLYMYISTGDTDGPKTMPGALKYTFRNGNLAPAANYNGWSTTIPPRNFTEHIYVIMVNVQSDQETVDIASSDWSAPVRFTGDNGEKGLMGKIMRGVNKYNVDVPEGGYKAMNGDDMFYDVVYLEDTYGNKTFYYYEDNTHPGGPGESNSGWTEASYYNFVATKVLLADNATIDVMSGNAVYMRDGNDIAAGLQGGVSEIVGGKTVPKINIFAGGYPNEAPFQVNSLGEMTATKGVIGPWELNPNGLEYNKDGESASFNKNGLTVGYGVSGGSYATVSIKNDVDAYEDQAIMIVEREDDGFYRTRTEVAMCPKEGVAMRVHGEIEVDMGGRTGHAVTSKDIKEIRLVTGDYPQLVQGVLYVKVSL